MSDVQEKREAFAVTLRNSKHKAILSSKRSKLLPPVISSTNFTNTTKMGQVEFQKSFSKDVNPFQLLITVQNMQSIQGEQKSLNAKRWLNSKNIKDSDIVFLTETRTNYTFSHLDHTTIQTKNAKSGGVI